jgi:hypothetical protein
MGGVSLAVVLSGCGHGVPGSALAPSVGVSASAPGGQSSARLASILAALKPPAGSTEVTTDPRADVDHTSGHIQYGSGPGFSQRDRYWTTKLAPAAAIDALDAHPPAGLSGGPAGGGTIGGREDIDSEYAAPETAALDGPHLYLNAEALPSGITAISAHVWETVKPAKTPDEFVSGSVTSVDASISMNGVAKPVEATLTGVSAQQLAADLDGLWVTVAMPAAGCGGSASSTFAVLAFHTSNGIQRFDTSCGTIAPDPQPTASPTLSESPPFLADLDSDFVAELNVPFPGSGDDVGPTTAAPTADRSPLDAMLDRLVLPADARVVAPPDGIEDGAAGYTGQPGFQQAARAWTTSLAPADAIAVMTKQSPPGMTGGVQPPEPDKGPPEAYAFYQSPDSATTIGPRISLSAVEYSPGTTTVEALAWQIDRTAKPVRDTVTGTVISVTASYRDGTTRSSTLSGAPAQQLATDVNALLVNRSAPAKGCGPATPTLTLEFRTSTGVATFADSCGLMTVLPLGSEVPELETSDALNLDVNRDFVSLLPTPRPSSAPLPTS